ncbi:hypothetical protein ACFYKX_05520 [Cytobacillus sp. FJAT-54145]|uniref:Uncharacterized protein n=1 Tax=Cytobacillus spartinae TaxID=3299023 RepID=A0ABW6KBH8_9BACI
MIDFNNRVFMCKANHNSLGFTTETVFRYKQYGDIIHANYSGGNVKYGEFIGTVNSKGIQQVAFNHINTQLIYFGGTSTISTYNSNTKPIQMYGTWCIVDLVGESIELVLEEVHEHKICKL